MKKSLSIIFKILFYVLLFAVGVMMGASMMFSILFADSSNVPLTFVLLIIGFIIVYFLCVIIHEGGHLVFGLISGYRFSSFRIGSIMLIKRDGKMQIRLLKIAGTGGQCLMIPPEEREGKIPTLLYNLGGVIANLICTLVFAVLFVVVPYVNVLTQLFIFGVAISLLFAILNGIPMNLGVPNDGANALSLRKNPIAAKALRQQLLIASENTAGVAVDKMPKEWFTPPEGADMNNPLCSAISVFHCNRLMAEGRFDEANTEMQRLMSSGITLAQLHRNLLACERIFCTLVLDGRDARIAHLYTPAQKKFMQSMKSSPSILRTEYAIALIRDKDEKEAEKIKQNFEKRAKSYPYPQEIETERAMMRAALLKYENEKK